MYVTIKENSHYYPAIINMDNVVNVTIDRGGSGSTEYRLVFLFSSSPDGETYHVYEFKTKTKALEQLNKIQNGIKRKQRFVDLNF
jgi:hypothetical protein